MAKAKKSPCQAKMYYFLLVVVFGVCSLLLHLGRSVFARQADNSGATYAAVERAAVVSMLQASAYKADANVSLQGHLESGPPGKDNQDPFNALLSRVFHADTAKRIRVSVTGTAATSYFLVRVTSDRQALEVEADSILSACGAVQHYCLNYAACTTTWGESRKPRLPLRLPAPPEGSIRRERVMRYAYYMNFCTPSYTMAWWAWDRWERELDWMAMHGINMPLIITGREVVMRKLLLEQGMTNEQVLAYFTGPAFLAWHRMGNLKGYAGPIPESYLQYAESLTRKILQRARELGMTPVLPGFSGHVPDQLQELFPKGSFSRLPLWSGFPAEYSGLLFVEPSSDLYFQLGKRFVEIQGQLFGTDHMYAVDQFNENNPKSRDSDYLSACGQTQFESMRQGDPEAVWILQGWLFVFHASFWGPQQIEAYISKVPDDRLIVLDLISEATPAYESTRSYHGKPFIWSLLHNFGGQIGLRGNLATVMERPYAAKSMPRSTMVGVGLTMEAINQNPVMYELALDHVWNDGPRPMQSWLNTWVRARYGYRSRAQASADTGHFFAADLVQQAWQLLLRSCYSVMDHASGNGFWGVTKSVIEMRPSMQTDRVLKNQPSDFQAVKLQYNACDVVEAWRLFCDTAKSMQALEAGQQDLAGSAFELDMVDVTRQVLSNHAQVLYIRFIDHSKIDGADFLDVSRQEFLGLFDDLDDLLSTLPHFSFELWLEEAHQIANSGDAHGIGTTNAHSAQAERNLYTFNARNLVTRWGPNGQINDYSARLWSGLIRDYYKGRWSIALEAAVRQRRAGQVPTDSAFVSKLMKFEEDWQHKPYGGAADSKKPVEVSAIFKALQAFDKYYGKAAESCAKTDVTGCVDEYAECKHWASSGECEKNSQGMLGYCKKSCRVCS